METSCTPERERTHVFIRPDGLKLGSTASISVFVSSVPLWLIGPYHKDTKPPKNGHSKSNY